jgi:hypothetical protein
MTSRSALGPKQKAGGRPPAFVVGAGDARYAVGVGQRASTER